jgi:GMP synthase-like glutamine amidotransferase
MKPKVVLLDCVGDAVEGGAGPWFAAALAKIREVDFGVVRPEEGTGGLDSADAVLISGSPRDAFADDEWTSKTLRVVEHALGRKVPVLGVCFGHQLLGRLAGAKVGRNPQGWEVGECIVRSTGAPSPLNLPTEARVLQSHQDSVAEIPAGARLLAGNEHTAVQAAEWGDRVYGVQFHPEFTGEILRKLWSKRRELWRGKTAFDLDAKLDAAGECEDGLAVFRGFLEIV